MLEDTLVLGICLAVCPPHISAAAGEEELLGMLCCRFVATTYPFY
jgi:hypothetical protein